MQPTAGFWEFVRMCFDAAWDATLAYLKLEPRAVGIAVVALIAGFLLFWWRRGVKKAQEKAVEDFLWITAPFAGIALILLVVNIVRSPHLVYRADQEGARQVINQRDARINQLEQEKHQLADDLQKERDRNNPKFELGWAQPTVGEGYELLHGYTENYTDVYIQVSVLNHGAPSVINGCKGIAHLVDGSELESFPYEPLAAHISVKGTHGLDLLPTSPSLIKVWSITPIPTGGRGVGYVIFRFPHGTTKQLSGPGGKLTIKIWDISGKEYEFEIPWTSNPSKERYSLPGMAPMH